MGKMQRDKGCRWERAVAAMFREALPGEDIRRGWQARSGSDEPDVIVPGWWVEAKVGKAPPLMRALRQAQEAAEGDALKRTPIAVVKQDRCEPVVLLALDDFLALLGDWYERGK